MRHPWRAALHARRVLKHRPEDDRGWAMLGLCQTLLGNYRFAVSASTVASLAVSGFPATTAGTAQTFTVKARDAYGNVVTGYTGTVAFSSSDVRAGLPSSYTFTAADAGVHTFTATLKTAGTQSLTVKDTANATITGCRGIPE